MSKSNTEALTVVAVCIAALAVRAITMALTVDAPGDGPSHAIHAYDWAQHPHLAGAGVWLPGFTYCAGIVTWAVENPLIAPRLTNLIAGTVTIAAFYTFTRGLYGPAAALLSAVTLAALPLHVGLSASSLTEPLFLLFIVVALRSLTHVLEGDAVRTGPLALFVCFFVFAEMTRYEAWALIPLVSAYLSVKGRSAPLIILVSVALLGFPTLWSFGNCLKFGNPVFGILQGMHPLEGRAVSTTTALADLAQQTHRNFGWLFSIAAITGFVMEFWGSIRRRTEFERLAYCILVSMIWVLIFVTARSRGGALYERYLLLGYALAIPFAVLAYLQQFGNYRHSVAVGSFIVIGSMAVACFGRTPTNWITRKRPTEIIALARWLPSTPYRNDNLLLTKMGWKSGYLPLYAPQINRHYLIVSEYVDDSELRKFIEHEKPSILATQSADVEYVERIERILGCPIRGDKRVFRDGSVEVYDITNPFPLKPPRN